jgi:hypothetical protein
LTALAWLTSTRAYRRGYADHVETIDEEELAALAMAADPDAPLPPDAVPIHVHLSQFAGALPLWYMPPVVLTGGRGRRWKKPVVISVVAAFLLIDAMGLCNTYGILSLA